ncbi:dihydrolipoyllysine-residue acetyltransferase [Ferrimonas marina]|uniref:Dihydrolipoamide acetyltransferase component of pyruvate dehydrogenase complex n=1 Tax=Ferrimonas marina TaxID=299255 RepID=A0A1M5Z3M0_9GAMM|nr:dihydrolipoyllysine-residue acetyltransferase [Ferrimonas marina]SHI18835.1 2-oxoisovalerate dehydrogenase E2 component (dihydrolipoyl transacylase) [Ferrimonas marina]
MLKDFILPDIGEGVVECELVEWLVGEGDDIAEDQPVADVMTDKALVQIPAPYQGRVTKLYYNKGEIAKVHAPLFQVELEGTTAAADAPAAATETPMPAAEVPSQGMVSQDFILPDIGEGIVECELVEWLVAEGDQVEEDQPICDVMTDKALVQIPAKEAGVISKLYYQKGEIARVHEPLFALSVASSVPQTAQQTTAQPDAAPVSPTPISAATASSAAGNNSQAATAVSAAAPGKALASPAVRRLAREHDLDLSQVPGSGKNGRVLKEDVHHFLAQSSNAPVEPQRASQPVAAPVAEQAGARVEPIRGVAAAMAKQMTHSVQTIPHFTYCDEFDLTELVALRQSLKGEYEQQGVKLSLMPFFIKSLSMALTAFPRLNSRVNADCTELTYLPEHNIGLAVDGKLGLMVPNIKGVEQRSLLEVAQGVNQLIEQARDGRVAASDLSGGTISISNIGAIGGTVATPIINAPEVAIVALGKLQTLPRFNADGEVEARTLMQISWSGDHRVIDGATMARFCNHWRALLEKPERMLMHLR